MLQIMILLSLPFFVPLSSPSSRKLLHGGRCSFKGFCGAACCLDREPASISHGFFGINGFCQYSIRILLGESDTALTNKAFRAKYAFSIETLPMKGSLLWWQIYPQVIL